jgi:hypothetical protein
LLNLFFIFKHIHYGHPVTVDNYCSFVIFPEGEERKGWMECRVQLSKLKQFHDKQKVGEMLPGGHTGKSVAGESGMIKGQQITSSANINV